MLLPELREEGQDLPVTASPAAPRLRAVLLGASNLQVTLPAVVEHLRRAAAGPVEVLAACGHGRSYGTWSRYLFVRRLPGIAACGLWTALAGRPPLPTVALLTDVGNDLAYGETPETVARWIEGCLESLGQLGADTICTLLPLASLENMSRLRYYAARTILFPGRGVSWQTLMARARELDGRLRALARVRGTCLIEPEAAWYGIDPIHFRRGKRREVWDRILSAWPLDHPAGEPSRPSRHTLRGLSSLRAEEVRLFGVRRWNPQPAVSLADGTTVALY